MKVLFHCWEFPPNGSGVGYYIYQMSKALTACGHSCFIVTGKAQGEPEVSEGPCGTVYRLYSRDEMRAPGLIDRVLRIAAEKRVDLIEGPDHLGECAGLIATTMRPPVMIKAHTCNALKALTDSQILYWWQRFTVGVALWRERAQTRLEEFSIRNADMLCAPSQRIKEELVAQGLRDAASIDVIPNPVESVEPERGEESIRPVILFAGRLDIGKGVQFLPTILAEVVRMFPDTILEIAGNDSYAMGLGKMKDWLVARFGKLIKNVRFLGHLDQSQLHAAYRNAWVVIVPSRWDNFPQVVLDAMIREKAIVASPHGGMSEMLDGTSCVIRDPSTPAFAESVCAFLADKEARRLAGRSAMQKAAGVYSPEHVVRQYVDFVSKAG